MKLGRHAHAVTIPLAAAIVIAPLILHGPSYGHDFNFHLLNWMEAARQFAHGTLYPQWAYSPAYSAGEPRFVFYPPLSWMLGGLLGLLFAHVPGVSPQAAWTAAPIVFTWLCLSFSGWTMYYAARQFASREAALVASALYAANPYMLFTAYERTAYAELLAAAWMPLLILSVLTPKIRVVRVALPIALLWLTNVPAAVIGCYMVVLLLLLRIAGDRLCDPKPDWWKRALREIAVPGVAGLGLGIGLAAFYVLRAAWERRFVQASLATVGGMRIDQNFLFEQTGTSVDAIAHDAVLHSASCVAIILIACAALLLLAAWKVQRREGATAKPGIQLAAMRLLALLAILAFLLLAWSNPVWRHAPELMFLQFPWRLLIVVSTLAALGAAAALPSVFTSRGAAAALALAIAAALTICAYRSFRQFSDPDETVAASLQAFQQSRGSEPTDEYTPETADNDALTPGHPAYWLQATPADHSATGTPGPAPSHFTIEAAQPSDLVLNLREYPAWHVRINGALNPARVHRDDGLIELLIPAGSSTVDLSYTRMLDDGTGDGVTLLSALVLGGLLLRSRRTAQR